jgi:hypothetical protein
MHAGTRRGSLPAVALVLAVLLTGCGGEGGTPSAPTPPQTPTPPSASRPTQTVDLSPFVGVWDLTWRQTALEDTGHGGCVAETMRPMTGVPVKIVLKVTASGMTITNPWGDYACSYSEFKAADDGFTLGADGKFITQTCTPTHLAFRCSDGTSHSGLYPWTIDLHGRLSGNELVGEFSSDWADFANDAFLVGSYGEFTGTRR